MNFGKKEKTPRESMLDDRTKGIIFFVFYGIFFAVLILALRNNQGTEKVEDDRRYSVSSIVEGNYHYVYTLEQDSTTVIYEGDRHNEKEKFTMTVNGLVRTFFNNNGTILEKTNTWALAEETPYFYPEFLDIKSINQLVKNSKYLSKTEYANHERILRYQVSTTTMAELLKKDMIDIADEVNEIELFTNAGEVYQVKLDLTPYVTYLLGENHDVTYTLTYSNFGKVSEITQD